MSIVVDSPDELSIVESANEARTPARYVNSATFERWHPTGSPRR
jgi:hypothetical protein